MIFFQFAVDIKFLFLNIAQGKRHKALYLAAAQNAFPPKVAYDGRMNAMYEISSKLNTSVSILLVLHQKLKVNCI